MDMSFANQALAPRSWRSSGRARPRGRAGAERIDDEVARLKLASLGVEIDELTDDQRAYLSSWLR